MKYICIIIIGVGLFSCGENEEAKPKEVLTPIEKKANENELIKLEGNLYTEYYASGKNIKFQGRLDKNGERMGLWVGYFPNGKEQSQSEYLHGELHGITLVKHPNGTIYYTGEFKDGEKVGEWTYRNDDGSVKYVKNYDKD
jgi:antitoxin component YwqK of YwqJK toxin-antitoxin module